MGVLFLQQILTVYITKGYIVYSLKLLGTNFEAPTKILSLKILYT